MSTQDVQYFNRYTQRLETEQVYGEGWLRWTYGNPLGRIALFALVKRSLFSRWYGWRMDASGSRRKIEPFIQRYGLNVSEFRDPLASFQSFNDFFYRHLKPEARPVDPDPNALVFPADGRHLGFDDLSRVRGFFVKGERFELKDLLQDQDLADRFERGSMLISRLCPVDYHRYHFPVSGVPSEPQLIDGPLFSVNPIALRQDIRILCRNRRWITRIRTQRLGEVLMLEVGATNVGSAISTFTPGTQVSRGDEKGYFRFGGSLTICLFPRGKIRMSEDLLAQSANGTELYARVGDRFAVIA